MSLDDVNFNHMPQPIQKWFAVTNGYAVSLNICRSTKNSSCKKVFIACKIHHIISDLTARNISASITE